jgi:hypothetical protein
MQKFVKSGGRTKLEVFVYSYYTIMASAQYLLHGSWRDGAPASILNRFDVITAFRHAETGEMTISAARGRARPDVMSQFDLLHPIWYCWPLEFFVYQSPFEKLFDFFDLH